MKNILLVEDDTETAKLLQLHFHSQLYNLICCVSGRDAFSQINTIEFDLVILDISLPDMTGFEICKHLRDEGFVSPIIMLTSWAEEKDKVLAFELGADDYVTKPFGSLEFMSRIKALLRRGDQAGLENKKKEIIYKDVVIDTGKRKATVRGERLHLTQKEFDLLVLLASNPGKTFNRAELLEFIWQEKFAGYENTVTTHINRLRTKLEIDINKPEYILTSWGVGYRFSE
jgi:DNA-binding response OmpR family regulator